MLRGLLLGAAGGAAAAASAQEPANAVSLFTQCMAVFQQAHQHVQDYLIDARSD